MRWRMDVALRQSDTAMWAMLKLGPDHISCVV